MDDNAGISNFILPDIVAGHRHGAVGAGQLNHLVNETSGTANDGAGHGFLRDNGDHNGILRGSGGQHVSEAFLGVQLLGSQSGSVLVVGGSGSVDGAFGSIRHARVKADDRDFLRHALLQLSHHRVGRKSSQRDGGGILGHLRLQHFNLIINVGLGSGAIEVDFNAVVLSSGLSAGVNGLPELMLEALRHDGDVHLLFSHSDSQHCQRQHENQYERQDLLHR